VRLDDRELGLRVAALEALAAPRCELCPRRCRVDRERELGRCGQGRTPGVAIACSHRGEEPPLVGEGGAGTVFLTGCNLRCRFCQNHQISQRPAPARWLTSPEALAERFLALERQGCAVLEWVSPTQHLPSLCEALRLARGRGLSLPLVYNSNGYERTTVIELLDGIVDVWLPDAKYADDALARELSDAPDYVEVNRRALGAIARQVGPLELDARGVARRGLLIRHLVLPGHVADTERVLRWIGEALGPESWVSLMAQYYPAHELAGPAATGPLARPLTRREYRRAVEALATAGLELGWVQELSSCARFLPDFDRAEPFAPRAEVAP
jgi:putative pyruvate formate lyase activating enzyme